MCRISCARRALIGIFLPRKEVRHQRKVAADKILNKWGFSMVLQARDRPVWRTLKSAIRGRSAPRKIPDFSLLIEAKAWTFGHGNGTARQTC